MARICHRCSGRIGVGTPLGLGFGVIELVSGLGPRFRGLGSIGFD